MSDIFRDDEPATSSVNLGDQFLFWGPDVGKLILCVEEVIEKEGERWCVLTDPEQPEDKRVAVYRKYDDLASEIDCERFSFAGQDPEYLDF